VNETLEGLLAEVRACRACERILPLGPRPVLRASKTSRLLVVGQAPGTRVHATGIPWNDPSGVRLRGWLNLTPETFYDESRVAIIPMGLCYPGWGRSGDLPPRPECAPLWFPRLLSQLTDIRLTLLIGQYAQAWYLGSRRGRTLTDTVRAWRSYLPGFIPMPHPSPRNTMWLRRNPWFEEEAIPEARRLIQQALSGDLPVAIPTE